MSIRIFQGDCRQVMATLPVCSVDAIVTDPPYELGFMGKGWDSTGVANDPETWRQALRVLKPGGYLLAFSGTRTYHRMAVAIEDAGFEIRDQIGWLYGSGFPKSHNGEWGGTALKPAWEPICMARKALVGTVEANWRQHGTGALNIDGCRIGSEPSPSAAMRASGKAPSSCKPGEYGDTIQNRISPERWLEPKPGEQLGRWPANVLHDGSDEVVAAFPDAIGAQGDVRGTEPSRTGDESTVCYGKFAGRVAQAARKDGGSAARFFYCAKADRADRNEGLGAGGPPAVGTAATMRDREDADWKTRNGNHHPTVKPTDLMRYLCRLVTPPGGVVLDPFMGSGSTLKAAELEGFSGIGIELSPDYIAIAKRRIAGDAPLFADVEVA